MTRGCEAAANMQATEKPPFGGPQRRQVTEGGRWLSAAGGRLEIRWAEGGSDNRHDRVGRPVDVGGSEAQKAKAGVDHSVLAAVVLKHAFAVGASVIFQGEAVGSTVKIRPAEEMTALVVEWDLCLRSRKSRQDEQQAQASLHRRLRRWLGQFDDLPEASHALAPRVGLQIRVEVSEIHRLTVQGHVHCHYRLDKR